MTKVDYLKPRYWYWKGAECLHADSNNKNGNKLIFAYLEKDISLLDSTILKKIQNASTEMANKCFNIEKWGEITINNPKISKLVIAV